MSQTCAELSHLVDLIDALALEEVEAVEVLVVVGEEQLAVGLLYRQHGLEDGALALLNPLTHRVQVGGEVAGSGEDTLAILAFALSVELLPPLGDEVQLRLEVGDDLNLLAKLGVEGLTGHGVLLSDVVGEGDTVGGSGLHILRALDDGLDVEAGHGDGQQTYRREHREAATHVVGDDESLIAFLLSGLACGALHGVGDGDDDLLGGLLATLSLALLLKQTEGEGGLGCRTALRDIDDAEALVFQIFSELGEIVLADAVAGEDHVGGLSGVVDEPLQRVAEGLDDGACTEIGAADTSHDDGIALRT